MAAMLLANARCSASRSTETVRHRRGFTMIEMLVLGLILLLLLSIFIPFIHKTREHDHRIQCQNNLRAIATALSKYAEENSGSFRRVFHDTPNARAAVSAKTGPYA